MCPARNAKCKHLKKRRYAITAQQKEELEWLRRHCAESGFYVYDVAYWYRRTTHDFIVFPKDNPNMLIIVSPNCRGQIELRTYVLKTQHYHLTKQIRQRKVKLSSIIWREQLPSVTKNFATDWLWFIPKKYRSEIALL